MNTLTLSLMAVLLTSGLTGCKKSSDDVAEEAVTMMEEMAQLIDSNKADCKKMGDALEKFVDANKSVIERAKGLRGDKAKSKELKAKFGSRLKQATQTMIGGAMKCATQKTVANALKKMR